MSKSNDADSGQEPALESEAAQRRTTLPSRYEAATRSRNWDAYAAMVATLIGLLALIVAGYTAYVQRQQLRAQVWPYVRIGSTNVPPEVGFHVINSGTGPARVRAVRVTIDRRPVPTWWEAQKMMGAEPGGIIQSGLSRSVLPPGKDHVMIRPFNDAVTPRFMELFLGDKHAIDVILCYCSVLDECWVVSSGEDPVAIGGPDECPIPPIERFKN